MKFPIPDAALAQHTAILGKTGSGKTTTGKDIVEHLVSQGARVCILDPIKSDWWGLTSSADGKKPGLPFHILGGPRGHVPLHSSSGKAIAEIVANGNLPLSILDMADFQPGGQARFFIDFAPALLRRVRGVVHLVMEEAHLFAPKERSGVGDENMAIHWAKMLATAGRSKGIRLILLTQRTQALHNALLGSCETMVAHRLTAPADQRPLIDWLKANVQKDIVEEVSSSLAALKTGTAWVCSGEAKFFQLVKFPPIKTYDNSATPEAGSLGQDDVRTAPVDVDKLRAIVGDAAKEAEANDPKALKAQVARLTAELAKASQNASKPVEKINTAPDKAKERAAAATIKTLLKALEAAMKFVVEINASNFFKAGGDAIDKTALEKVISDATDRAAKLIEGQMAQRNREIAKLRTQGEHIAGRLKAILEQDVSVMVDVQHNEPFTTTTRPAADGRAASPPRAPSRIVTGGGTANITLPPGERAVLVAAAQFDPVEREQLTILTGYKRSSRDAYIQRLREKGFVDAQGSSIRITDEGAAALPADYAPLPTGADLQNYWLGRLPEGEKKILQALIDAYPQAVERTDLDEQTGYKRSSRDAYLQRMKAKRLWTPDGSAVRASEILMV